MRYCALSVIHEVFLNLWDIIHDLYFTIFHSWYFVNEISFKSHHLWHIVQELWTIPHTLMRYHSWVIVLDISFVRHLWDRLSRISRRFLPDKGGRWWWWMCHRKCRVWSPVCWRETTVSLVWCQDEAEPRSNLRIKYHFLVSSRWSNNDFVF